MHRTTFSIIFFLAVIVANGAQIPIFSAYTFNLQSYNPAFAGFNNRYEFSANCGYARSGLSRYESFALKRRSTNTNINGSSFFYDPNYTSISASLPVQLKNGDRAGFGITFTNNDLQRVETSNSYVLSVAYSWKLSKGRFGMGINLKRFAYSATDKRIYYTYESTDAAFFSTYKESAGNVDLGISYGNDSGTFNFGLSVSNIRKYTFAANSLDNIYQFYYENKPQLIAHSSHQCSLTRLFILKNDAIGITTASFKHTNYLLRSMVGFKEFGIGLQYIHLRTPLLGPALSFTNKSLDFLYSFSIDLENNMIVSGVHQAGVQIKI